MGVRKINIQFVRSFSMNHRFRSIRRLVVISIGILLLGIWGQNLQAQFQTGVRLNVVQQPGVAYFNPVQQRLLLAMQQRQQAYSNFGTAVNLQAAQMEARRQQIEHFRKAQQAQQQSAMQYQRAQQMWMQQNANKSWPGQRSFFARYRW